jgi:hypothetical protein
LEILENSIAYIKSKFQEIIITRTDNGVVFNGRFFIAARKDDFEISVAPRLEIILPQRYPLEFPIVKDIDNVIHYDHVYTDGTLCVATMFDLQLKLQRSHCISDYFEYFLIPYFISYEYWKKTGVDIFGDRTHGIYGVFESLQDHFGISKKDIYLLKDLICWASRKIKFRKLVLKGKQAGYIDKYSLKIGVLRKTSVPRLRRIYKLIELFQFSDRNKKEFTEQVQKLINLIYSS